MKILAISGSLRAASNNTALLRAAARLSPAGIGVELYRDLGKLPLFNPDMDFDDPPFVVSLRKKTTQAGEFKHRCSKSQHPSPYARYQ